MRRPGPMLYAFHTRMPHSSYWKLFNTLMPGILLSLFLSLVVSTSTTAALHPLIPPWDSSAAFISSAVTTSCFSLTQRFMCAFIAAVFLSQMSLPACGSEKSYRTGLTPVLTPTSLRLNNRGPLW